MLCIIQLNRDITPLIPKITTSRAEFISFIIKICKENRYTCHGFDIKQFTEGLDRINSKKYRGHYFCGLIFVESLDFLVIHHELMHHAALKLKFYTKNDVWLKFENLMDRLQYAISMTRAKLECKILNLVQRKIHYYITE